MVNLRTAADRTQGQAVDFLVNAERITGELDADIAQHARVVVGVGTAVLRARTALNLLLTLIVCKFIKARID